MALPKLSVDLGRLEEAKENGLQKKEQGSNDGFMSSIVAGLTKANADQVAKTYKDILNQAVNVGFSNEDEKLLGRVIKAYSTLHRFAKHLNEAFKEVPDYFVNNFLRALFIKWAELDLKLGDIENSGDISDDAEELLRTKLVGESKDFAANWLNGEISYSDFMAGLEGVWRYQLERDGYQASWEVCSDLSILIPFFEAFSEEEDCKRLVELLDEIPARPNVTTVPGVQFASLSTIVDEYGVVRSINHVFKSPQPHIPEDEDINPEMFDQETIPPSPAVETLDLNRGEYYKRRQRLVVELEQDYLRHNRNADEDNSQSNRIVHANRIALHHQRMEAMVQEIRQNNRSTQEMPVDDIERRLEEERAAYIDETPTIAYLNLYLCDGEGNPDPQVSGPLVKARIYQAVELEMDSQSAQVRDLQNLLDEFMECDEEEDCRDLINKMERYFGPEVLDFLREPKRRFGARPYIPKEEDDDLDGGYVERVDIEANIPTDQIKYL